MLKEYFVSLQIHSAKEYIDKSLSKTSVRMLFGSKEVNLIEEFIRKYSYGDFIIRTHAVIRRFDSELLRGERTRVTYAYELLPVIHKYQLHAIAFEFVRPNTTLGYEEYLSDFFVYLLELTEESLYKNANEMIDIAKAKQESKVSREKTMQLEVRKKSDLVLSNNDELEIIHDNLWKKTVDNMKVGIFFGIAFILNDLRCPIQLFLDSELFGRVVTFFDTPKEGIKKELTKYYKLISNDEREETHSLIVAMNRATSNLPLDDDFSCKFAVKLLSDCLEVVVEFLKEGNYSMILIQRAVMRCLVFSENLEGNILDEILNNNND